VLFAVQLQRSRALSVREQNIQALLEAYFDSHGSAHPGLHKLFLPLVAVFAPQQAFDALRANEFLMMVEGSFEVTRHEALL